jgi:hypothetical protein
MFESAEYLPTEADRLSLSRERFLTSHRAIGACAREFGRLAEEFVDRAEELQRELGIEQKPELRLTPDRCVVQIGPVALSVAWLRGALDSLADGRLLIIAWRGTITRRRFSEAPIRANTPNAVVRTAVTVWEETFLASAESETSWKWQSETDASRSYASAELAELCIAHARAAWELQQTA